MAAIFEASTLGRVVLGFPKPLECTESIANQLRDLLVYNGKSPMWCSTQTDTLGDGLNPKALCCSMLLLISLALCLFCFALLFFVFNLPLKVHYSTSSSLDFCLSVSNSTSIRLPLFMALAIRSLCLFNSSSASVDSPLQLCWEFPV